MADTLRTLSALLALLADNTSGAISPQDLRDFLVSVAGYRYGRAVSTGQALTLDDRVVEATGGSGGITLTLPQASTAQYKTYQVVKVDAGAGAVTLDAYSSETINGATTYALASQWDKVSLYCNGTSWTVIGA